jgi:CheY-like chemotaxis protein
MAGEPILIVDDTPLNVKLLEALLEPAGYDVRSAANARETLAILASFRPRLILLDVQLPDMDGLELARRLRADPATRAISLVAVSSHAQPGDAEKALAAGCDAYLTKPLDTRALPHLVACYLQGPPLREERRP